LNKDEKVYLNGLLLIEGPDRDFNRKKSKIRFLFRLRRGDVIVIEKYSHGLLKSSKFFENTEIVEKGKWKKYE